jgi:GxxExxY protein
MTLTGQIIGAAMEVHRTLGPGFVESIYHRALLHELGLRRLFCETEVHVEVSYKNQLIGQHRLDLVVENTVIVELKAVSAIVDTHIAQTLSYLKATNIEVALIVNFGLPSLTWKRLIKSREFRELREFI